MFTTLKATSRLLAVHISAFKAMGVRGIAMQCSHYPHEYFVCMCLVELKYFTLFLSFSSNASPGRKVFLSSSKFLSFALVNRSKLCARGFALEPEM